MKNGHVRHPALWNITLPFRRRQQKMGWETCKKIACRRCGTEVHLYSFECMEVRAPGGGFENSGAK